MTGARVGVLTAIAGVGLLGLTACTGESPGSPVPQRQQADELPVGPQPNLVAADNTTLGAKIMTDKDGKTLYLFGKDTTQPPVSTCNDACAQQWPPLLVEGKQITFTGIDQTLIGTVIRKDGSKQITINRWPVYLFAKDKAPGDVSGQAMGETWYAITPDGKKAQGVTGTANAVPQQQKPADEPPPDNSGYDTGSGY
jgi:predicted lipoprotein with Yx(FWY)xxD motif